ncbi:MAG: hypothetical protein H6696_17385 [Deferribacteres bacterium]|nr:hypothetical protein [candidate division KSB1 bacterium]MCB9503710.1 hypothetical protein [Deferribacteres bacterium]
MHTQVLFLANSASSRAIVQAALNSSDNMNVIVCESVLELLHQFCQTSFDVLMIEPDGISSDDLEILLRFIPTSIPLLYLIEEMQSFDYKKYSSRQGAEILVKLTGYLTALPYQVQNSAFMHKTKQSHGEIYKPVDYQAVNGWCELDADMKFQRSSPVFENLTEYSQADLKQFTILDVFHDESRNKIQKIVFNSSENNMENLVEVKLNCNGEEKYLTSQFRRIKNNQQKTIGWRCEFFHHKHYKPELANNDNTSPFAHKLWDLANRNFQKTFSIFFRILADKCADIFQSEHLTLARYNQTTNKFVFEAIRGEKLPLDSLLEQHSAALFTRPASGTPKLFTFSDSPDKNAESGHEFHIEIPSGFGLQSGWILPFINPDGKPVGCLAVSNSGLMKSEKDAVEHLNIVYLTLMLILGSFLDKESQNKKERRLHQVLVTSSIFKLQLPMRSLMREMAWSIKFSFDAFLTTLALFDQKDRSLGFYAVASDDKHLILSLAEEKVREAKFLSLLQNGKTIRKSYLVPQIGITNTLDLSSGTSERGFIVTPIFDNNNKMMGAIILCERRNMPFFELESVTILETIAKQIAVGISNRVLYSRALKQPNTEPVLVKTQHSNGKVHEPSKKPQRFWSRMFS